MNIFNNFISWNGFIHYYVKTFQIIFMIYKIKIKADTIIPSRIFIFSIRLLYLGSFQVLMLLVVFLSNIWIQSPAQSETSTSQFLLSKTKAHTLSTRTFHSPSCSFQYIPDRQSGIHSSGTLLVSIPNTLRPSGSSTSCTLSRL